MTGKLVPEIAVTCGDWPLISLVPVFPTCQLHQVPVFGRRKKTESQWGDHRGWIFLENLVSTCYPTDSGSALPGHVEWCPVMSNPFCCFCLHSFLCRSCNSDCVTKRMGWGCGSWMVTSFFPTSPAWVVVLYCQTPIFFTMTNSWVWIQDHVQRGSQSLPRANFGKFTVVEFSSFTRI